jgi:hypothetical protein
MQTLLDLKTFARILTEKGYDGYFTTQAGYPAKLEDSISQYLENCKKGVETQSKSDILLQTYLQWNGEDKPRVECQMWVKSEQSGLALQKIEITRKDCAGNLLKQSSLVNVSTIDLPTAKEALAMVNDLPRHRRPGRTSPLGRKQ